MPKNGTIHSYAELGRRNRFVNGLVVALLVASSAIAAEAAGIVGGEIGHLTVPRNDGLFMPGGDSFTISHGLLVIDPAGPINVGVSFLGYMVTRVRVLPVGCLHDLRVRRLYVPVDERPPLAHHGGGRWRVVRSCGGDGDR